MKKKFLALILTLCMVLSLVPVYAFAADGTPAVEPQAEPAAEPVRATKTGTVLAFTSDTHNISSSSQNDPGSVRLGKWLDKMNELYGGVDAMAFGGDMANASASATDYWSLTAADIKQLTDRSITGVYTTGNHEHSPGRYSATSTDASMKQFKISTEGTVGDNYRIYCLGSESSSQSYSSSQITALTNYLNGVGADKPIFIITHFPLHYCSGSFWGGRTTQNALSVINVLNDAASNGKKIVFLWGHNHTESDSYYDQIYKPGDKIEYTSGSTTEIQFYYGAAGCMSDSEYGTGSASVKGKGLIVTIDDQKNLTFTYHNANGADVTEGGSFTEQEVAVTGVSVSPATATVKVNKTIQLTATVSPATATNKAVTWTSSNASVAEVSSNGLVTGRAVGTATITAKTADAGKTATSTISVVENTSTTVTYALADTFEDGKDYIIANGNTGSVYVLTTEAGGSRTLKGIAATVSDGKITLDAEEAENAAFTAELKNSASGSVSAWLKNGGKYLYTNNANGLAVNNDQTTNSGSTDNTGKFWHYKADGKDLLWYFKDTSSSDGYTDTSQTYKYYLECNNGNFTDSHVSTTSLANTSTPKMYIYVDSEVTPDTTVDYVLTDTLKDGGEYLIANAKTGSAYVVSTTANGDRTLKGIAVNVVDGKITVSGSTAKKAAFTAELKTSTSGSVSAWLKNSGKYLYTNSANGLRMVERSEQASTDNTAKVWHYKADGKDLLWYFKDTNTSDGYTDTSSTYKYYLECSNGNFTDNHVSTTSLANTNTPVIYLFEKSENTHVHTYGEPEWIWSNVNTKSRAAVTAKAVFTCTECGETREFPAEVTETEKDGKVFYVATAAGPDGEIITDEKEKKDAKYKITFTTDKVYVVPGDEVTYTITLGPVDALGSFQFKLVIPTGLTYMAESFHKADGLIDKLGFDTLTWTENSKVYNGYGVVDYVCEEDTVLATFKCTVNSDFTGAATVETTKHEFFSSKDYRTPTTSDYEFVYVTVTNHDHEAGEAVYEWTGSDADGYTAVKGYIPCTICEEAIVTETVAPTYAVTTQATCEEAGVGTWTATFTKTGLTNQTKTVEIPATGHNWGEITYTWAEDNSEVTAKRVCANDATHVETETVAATSEVTTAATCTAEGVRTWTSAAFKNTAFAVQTKTEAVPALGHDWEFVNITWTEAEDGYTAAANYVCGNDETHKQAVNAAVTKAEGTGENAGYTVYTATVAAADSLDEAAHTDTKKVVIVYTIEFEPNEGMMPADVPETYTVESDAITLPTPAKEGFIFGGWFENEDLSGTAVTAIAKGSTGNKMFYAKWTPDEFTVTFDAQGHGTAPAAQTVDNGAKATEPEALTETGYTFGGWYKEAACTNEYDFDTPVTADITLYAKWTANTYTVKFNANGGTGTMADQNFTYDVSQTLAENQFTRANYRFMGWAKTRDGDLVYGNGATVSNLTAEPNGVVELFAVWDENDKIVVTFDKNGGEGTMAAQPIYKGVATVLTANTFTREGHTFAGWNTAADGKGTAYADGATVTFSEDTILYAQWKVNTYTITWKNEDGSVIGTTTVAYGAMPTHDAPTKAADADYIYTFKEWTPAVVAATADAAYTAVFTSTPRTYGGPVWTWTGSDADGYTKAVATFTTNDGGPEFKKTVDDEEIDVTTTAATCVATGKTVYTAKVTFNGTEYTDKKEVVIPATGHKPGEHVYKIVTEPSKTAAGTYTDTVVCSVCGEVLSTETKRFVTYIGANLALKGNINMNFYVNAPIDDWTAEMKYEKDGSTRTVDLDSSIYKESSGGFKITFTGIAAKEMTEHVTLVIKDYDGVQVDMYNPKTKAFISEMPYAIVDYVNLALAETEDPNEAALMKAILNYGESAQKQFGHKLDDLANPEGYLAEEMSKPVTAFINHDYDAVMPENAKEDDAIGFIGCSLMLKDATSIRLYFKNEVTSATIDGKTAEVKHNSNGYYVERKDIASKDLDTKYTFKVKIGGVEYTFIYCALSWCNETMSVEEYESDWNICKALYLYNAKANAFFGK